MGLEVTFNNRFNGIELNNSYIVTADGTVYSKKSNRWLKKKATRAFLRNVDPTLCEVIPKLFIVITAENSFSFLQVIRNLTMNYSKEQLETLNDSENASAVFRLLMENKIKYSDIFDKKIVSFLTSGMDYNDIKKWENIKNYRLFIKFFEMIKDDELLLGIIKEYPYLFKNEVSIRSRIFFNDINNYIRDFKDYRVFDYDFMERVRAYNEQIKVNNKNEFLGRMYKDWGNFPDVVLAPNKVQDYITIGNYFNNCVGTFYLYDLNNYIFWVKIDNIDYCCRYSLKKERIVEIKRKNNKLPNLNEESKIRDRYNKWLTEREDKKV